MDVLASSAISTINWFTSSAASRDGRGVGGALAAKTSLQYITNLYNYWQQQSGSKRNQEVDSSLLSDEICYINSLPVRTIRASIDNTRDV